MNVEYVYDETAESALCMLKLRLEGYERLLLDKLKEDGLPCFRHSFEFISDEGRQSLVDEIAKVYSLAIPVGCNITGL